MTERELIEQAQCELADAKKGMRAFRASMRELMKLNTKEGRLSAANKVMIVKGDASAILGAMDRMHGEATIFMNEEFPEFASDIQTFGPGGGR